MWKFEKLQQDIQALYDGNTKTVVLYCVALYNKSRLVQFTQPIENNDIEQAMNCLKKRYLEFTTDDNTNDNTCDNTNVDQIHIEITNIKINEIKSNITNNEKYKEFIKNNPELLLELTKIIDEYCDFKIFNNKYSIQDFYFESQCYPIKGVLNLVNSKMSWDEELDMATKQMDTTRFKFSIDLGYYCKNNTLLYAKLFEDIGFTVILGTFESVGSGYGYYIRQFDEKDYNLFKNDAEYIFVYLL